MVFGEHTAEEKLRVFVSLCKSLRGEKREKLEQLSGEQIPPISEKFFKEDAAEERWRLISLPHSGVNLLGCLLQSHLTAPGPAGLFLMARRVKSGLGGAAS